MARIYADEDFALPAVEHLRRLGHDVLTARDAGQANRKVSDPAVLTFATGDGRAVLSFNRFHFIRLHQQRSVHKGIIVCTFDINFVDLASRIHAVISPCVDLSGQLFRITKSQGRV